MLGTGFCFKPTSQEMSFLKLCKHMKICIIASLIDSCPHTPHPGHNWVRMLVLSECDHRLSVAESEISLRGHWDQQMQLRQYLECCCEFAKSDGECTLPASLLEA